MHTHFDIRLQSDATCTIYHGDCDSFYTDVREICGDKRIIILYYVGTHYVGKVHKMENA